MLMHETFKAPSCEAQLTKQVWSQSPLDIASAGSAGSLPSRRASTAVMSPMGSVQGAAPMPQMGSPLSRQGSKLKRKLSKRRLGAQQSSAVARHNLFLKACPPPPPLTISPQQHRGVYFKTSPPSLPCFAAERWHACLDNEVFIVLPVELFCNI